MNNINEKVEIGDELVAKIEAVCKEYSVPVVGYALIRCAARSIIKNSMGDPLTKIIGIGSYVKSLVGLVEGDDDN